MICEENEINKWPLPDIENERIKEEAPSSLFGKPATWYTQEKKIATTTKETSLKPLTLDDIEEIRKSAFEDGFSEGKEAGFAKGLEDGTAEGLKQGLEQGMKEGEEKGLDQGAARIDEMALNWEGLIDRLHNPLEKLDNNVEYQLINLATTLAEQITRCEVEKNPQVILQALKQGVDALPVSEQVLTIMLHPDDLIFVQQAYSAETCVQRKWDLQNDPTLLRGDCQIHTQTSTIDYAFNSRIKQVLAQFYQQNFQNLPVKNNDSNLLNDEPLVEVAEEGVETNEEEIMVDLNNDPEVDNPNEQP